MRRPGERIVPRARSGGGEGLLPWEDATKGERSAREAMDWVGEVLGW